ncbi:hypothetical protein VTL71DRAFT_9970 [Oculimacula yallundae]|uniref:Uncharacterized protein n=1 Tax=Oculimacula yallundae TaxID=86028 RepID=A0ABR4BR32_9HELO
MVDTLKLPKFSKFRNKSYF